MLFITGTDFGPGADRNQERHGQALWRSARAQAPLHSLHDSRGHTDFGGRHFYFGVVMVLGISHYVTHVSPRARGAGFAA